MLRRLARPMLRSNVGEHAINEFCYSSLGEYYPDPGTH